MVVKSKWSQKKEKEANLSSNYPFYNPIMRKRWLQIHLLIVLPFFTNAQQLNIDSLVREANITRNDTSKLVRLRAIARVYAELNPDSSYKYANSALSIAKRLHLTLDVGEATREIGYAYLNKGNYPRSLQILLSAIAILEDPKTEQNVLVGKFAGDDALMYRSAAPHLQRLSSIAITEQHFGILYANSNNYEKAWYHHLLARQTAEQSGNLVVLGIVNPVSYTHLRAHETPEHLVCRLLLEKKNI